MAALHSTPPQYLGASNKFNIKYHLFTTVFQKHIENLNKIYNCNITLMKPKLDYGPCCTKNAKVGKLVITAETFHIIITPNYCNYLIDIIIRETFNTVGDKVTKTETVDFSLQLKNSSEESEESKKTTELGFYSSYVVDDFKIKHVYQFATAIPENYTQSYTNFHNSTVVFNPYLFLNSIFTILGKPRITSETSAHEIKKQLGTIDVEKLQKRINRDNLLDKIHLPGQIKTIDDIKTFIEQCNHIFANPLNKQINDTYLDKLVPLHHKKTSIEGKSEHYKLVEVYTTNYPVKNHMANRFAQYYPDFQFTKSIKSIQKKKHFVNFEYIDPIKQTLYGPFTISDLYIYIFPQNRITGDKTTIFHKLHVGNARDLFQINDPPTISRAFDLIELAKSFAFTFISSVFNVMHLGNEIRQEILDELGKPNMIPVPSQRTYQKIMPVRIFNVYNALPWVDRIDNDLYLVSSNAVIITFNVDITKNKSKYDVKYTTTYKPHEAHDNMDNNEFVLRTFLLDCQEAPFKLFNVLRAPYDTTVSKTSRNQPIYELVAIPDKSQSDGFEKELLNEPYLVKDRLLRRYVNMFSLSILRQIHSNYFEKPVYIYTEEKITQLIYPENNQPVDTVGYPMLVAPIKQENAEFDKIRLEGEIRRKEKETILRLIQQQETSEDEENERNPITFNINTNATYEEEDEEEDLNVKEVKIKKIMHFRTLNALLSKLKAQQEIAKNNIITTQQDIKSYEINASETHGKIDPHRERLKPNISSPMYIHKPDANIDSLRAKLDTLNKTYTHTQTKIDELQQQVDAARLSTSKTGKNKRKYKRRNKDRVDTRSYEKYLKYKIKYLALKKQHNA